MCHGFSYHADDSEESEQEYEPEFLNEEASVDSELVTDGGEGDEE